METESTPISSAKAPPLNSDQLNYLIWRYLQESGYGEAAVKLQRDWNVNAEALPFAKNIQGQALVKLVQKGLKYHHLQLTIDENGRSTKQLTPTMFFFGPESERHIPEPREPVLQPSSTLRAPSPETSLVVPQKRPGDVGPHSVSEGTPQPAAKRSRKTAKDPVGERNGAISRKVSNTAPTGSGNTVDVDMANGIHAPVQEIRSPSGEPAFEEEQPIANGLQTEDQMDVDSEIEQFQDAPLEVIPPLIATLTTGKSTGIQVAPAKIADLGPSTTVLEIPKNIHINQACWKPRSQHTIAGLGYSICGVFRMQNTTQQFQELVSTRTGDEKLVTAMAWEPNGQALAVATRSDEAGELHLYEGQEFGLLETLPAAQRAIIRLQWHKNGARLVGLAPFDEQSGASSIVLWNLSGEGSNPGPMSVAVPETLEDVDCIFADGDGFALATGGEAVYKCRAFHELEVEQKYSSFQTGTDKWSYVKCSWRSPSDTLLVAASSDTGRLWLPEHDMKRDAHKAAITGMQIRPQPLSGQPAFSTSEFATSSEDGSIKVWHYDRQLNTLTALSKLMLGFPQLLKTLSYSPDGFCLAGASFGTIRIWNAEHGYNQMASWEGDEMIWKGKTLKDDELVSNGAMSSVNGDALSLGIDHSLSWDTDSKRLAFALGSQVALINFQR